MLTVCVQVVVDAVDHNVLVAPCASQMYDLTTTTEAALLDIDMPLDFNIRAHPLPFHHPPIIPYPNMLDSVHSEWITRHS